MKKAFSHDELSDRKCAVCGKPIKARLVETKERLVKYCYKHWCESEARRGHTVNTKSRRKRLEENLPVKSFN